MQPTEIAPTESRAQVRDFSPVHAGGGTVAAAGLLLISVLACVSALPGTASGALYPLWLRVTFFLLPIPLAILVLAVFLEAQFKIRVDNAALSRRGMLGGLSRVPWDEVVDYFADCGRSPGGMAKTGGSMIEVPPVEGDGPVVAPFARFEPDYTIVHRSGDLILDDCLADLAELTHAVTLHAPSSAPTLWEEAAWVTCSHCGRSVAVSVRVDRTATATEGTIEGQTAAVACPMCDLPMEELAAQIGHGYMAHFRGRAAMGLNGDDRRTPDDD